MVVFVNTKNNTDALKAINIAKTTLKNDGYRNEKEKQYYLKKLRHYNNLIKKVMDAKSKGLQVTQVAFKFY